MQIPSAVLPPDRVVTDPTQLVTYEIDAGLDRGRPDGVVFPRSTAEVAQLVRWAAAARVPLIARGAGTGLAGGAVPEHGGVVVQLGLLRRVLELDAAGRSVVVEAGTVNLQLDALARAQGLYFPPDPSSQRSSTIGGNIGNNAGGPHCFKYGVTTNYVTGLEVVLADGRVVTLGGQALDYPEYDLVGLMVGGEGTLGIVTRADLRLLRDPPAVRTLMAAFDSVERAGAAVSAIIARGLVPATMEMMDDRIMRIVEAYAHPGLPLDAGAVLIVEVDGYPASVGPQIEEVAGLLREHGAAELRVAQSAAERDRIWLARKSAAGAMARLAPAFYLVDGTVPRSRLAEALAEVNRIIDDCELRAGHVFHAGDGNLHPLILIDDPADPALIARVQEAGRRILEVCVAAGGSITGEHGVGIEKRPFMALMYGPVELALMREVKQIFDPLGILNPGKVLPDEAAPETPLPVAPSAPDGAELPTALCPTSSAAAAEALRELIAAGRSVRIRGGGTKSHLLRPADATISTAGLAGVRECAPDDLYVTVGAGTRLADLQAELLRIGMWVPLASPWPEATLGGIVAANANAPLRMRYGAIRDLLLATTAALPDGQLVRLGRPVVKNVAGYDLVKLQVGAHGTLGLLCDLTLKLAPLPRARATLVALPGDLERALALAGRLLRGALVASALLIVREPGAAHGPWSVVYSAEGLAEDVAAELGSARAAVRELGAPGLQIADPDGSARWAAFVGAAGGDELLARVGVAPKELPALLRELEAAPLAYVADVAAGLVYLRAPGASATAALEQARRAARVRGGYAVALAAPQGVDPWGHAPGALDLMRELRGRRGADGLLNPGAFVV